MTLVKNGAQIQIGAELKIRVKNIPSDKTLEEWKINGKTVASATETFSHTIVKEDSDSNGKTYITYTLKNKPVLLKINFDTEQIKVESKQAGTWQPLSSGSEIVDNTQLRLTAIGLPADSTVQSWIVGKTNIPAEGHELTYIVRKTDANDNNIVTISYTERKSVNLKINFDAAQVKVEAEQAGTWNALTSGSTVQENIRLRLTALAVPAGKLIDVWKFGKTTLSGKGSTFEQTAALSHAENDIIAISYTLRDILNLTLNFDATKLKVEAEQAGTWNALTSGSTVQEHTRLRLTAIGLPAGTPVQAWKVGNTIVPAEGAELIHTVRKVDADSSNRVALAYTVKSDKLIIAFDKTKVRVFTYKGGIVRDGGELTVGMKLYIETQNLPARQIVDTWKIGKRNISADSNDYEYTVMSEDAESGIIAISYTTKAAKKFTLNFDKTKITVYERKEDGPWQTLSSGAQVEEGTRISIKANDIPVGHIVDMWTIGKRTFPTEHKYECWSIVKSTDAESGVITISYTTKVAQKFTLKFDEAKMTVTIPQQYGQGQRLSNGAQVEEGTGISIEAKNLTDQIVNEWKIGKRTVTSSDKNQCWYNVKSADAESGTITIDYTTKPAQQFTLTFDGSKMTVQKQQQHGPDQTLSSGAQVEEGTRIRIEAKDLPVGHIVDEWKIGKTTEEDHDGNRYWFQVGSDYAEGGTITISYTTKPAQKFTLNFDGSKMTVQKQQQHGPDQTLSNGAQVEEGTGISIEAKDLPVGEIVDEWTIGKRTFEDKGNWGGNRCWVRVGSDYAKDGTITIDYTTKPAQKFTLTFNAAKMTVRISQQGRQGKTLSNDAQVEEGTQISIEAKDLPTGHLVDTWTIGKRTEEANNNNGNSHWFRVGSDYAESGVINISYKTKPAQQFTLKFEEAKMTVTIPQQYGQEQTLSSGAQVEERTQISIEAKDLPAGKIVDEWTIGKRTFEDKGNWGGNRWWVRAGSDYAEGGTITISYKTKPAQKFTLNFDGSKMTVTIPQQYGQGQTLSNGAQVEERTQISIEAKDLPAGQIVDEWKIGKRTFEDDKGSNRCWIRVNSDYAEGGTISISYTTKNE